MGLASAFQIPSNLLLSVLPFKAVLLFVLNYLKLPLSLTRGRGVPCPPSTLSFVTTPVQPHSLYPGLTERDGETMR